MQQQEQFVTSTEREPEYYDPLVNPNQIIEPKDDFFRFMIDSLDLIDEVEMQLKGYVKKPNKDGIIKYHKTFNSWINNEGISRIKYIIYSLGINKNTLLGNLSRDEINYKCCMLKKKLALLLFCNSLKYDVEPNNKDLLIMTVVNTVHSGLSRCEDGKLSDEVTRIIQRHEIQHEGANKEDKGFTFNPFARTRRP